jgi:lysophospholipase L1-like esterase
MLMSGGQTFTGNSGQSYAAGGQQAVGPGDVRLALMNGWSPIIATYTPQTPPVAFKGLTNVQQVMASPPTVAISTTNPVSTGQQYVVSSGQVIDLSNFAITGGGNPQASGTLSPDNGLCSFNSVTLGASQTQVGCNCLKVSVIFTSAQATPEIAFVLKGLTGNITAKVNDQYVSLTPTPVPNSGALEYYSLTFAAAGTYRIDVIADNVNNSFRFGGCWTGSKTDSVVPASIRGGSRQLFLGDSLTTATGAPNTSAGYVQCYAEYMGLDDVWPSGVGGTGVINGNSAALPYINRVATDVVPFQPDEVFIQGFYNDGTYTVAAVQTALLALVQALIQALPAGVRIWIWGPYTPEGVGYQSGNSNPSSAGFVSQRTAIANVIAQVNSPYVKWLDPTTLPFDTASNLAASPVTYSITAPAASSATTLSTNTGIMAGAHYQWGDGSRFRCLSTSGNTATIDNNPNAQASGATFTQCGACWITGNGYEGATTGVGNADNYVFTDHVHLQALGHLNWGVLLARLRLAALQGGEG